MKISRAAYAEMFGPTIGDRVRLADTDLVIEVEKDLTVYGEEVKFGGGKVIRDGMGQSQRVAKDSADTVITNALVVDWWGIVKCDLAIKGGRITGELPALELHLVRRLPGPDDDLADAAHRLRIRRQHRERSQVVQDVLGGDRLAPDTRFGERDVLGDSRIEVMAHHQHVQVLIDGVDRIRPRRIGRRWQHVGLAAGLDDVGCVAAARAFGVIGMDRPATNRLERRFDEARLVQRVGVNCHLHIHAIGDLQRRIDCRGRRAPVFVQLQADRARLHLLDQRR